MPTASVPNLTAHDLDYFRELKDKLRTRAYSVTGREASDAIATLLHHVEKLRAAAKEEARA